MTAPQDRQPATEAGRELVASLADVLGTTVDANLGAHGEQFRERIVDAVERAIPCIEREARAQLIAELREGVEGLDAWIESDWQDDAHFQVRAVSQDAVLALIEKVADE